MKKRSIIFIILIIIILPITLFYFLIGIEQYNYIYPHIDTVFSENFDIDNFDDVKIGMAKVEVETLLGKPLTLSFNKFGYTDSIVKNDVVYFANYSSDGKYKYADYAWENFEIHYSKNFLVVSKRRVWLND